MMRFKHFIHMPKNRHPSNSHVTSQRVSTIMQLYMKSFIAKRVISISVNLRYLRFKLLKYKENNKKICYTFDRNFRNIPLYIGIIRKALFCIIR